MVKPVLLFSLYNGVTGTSSFWKLKNQITTACFIKSFDHLKKISFHILKTIKINVSWEFLNFFPFYCSLSVIF